LKRTSTVAASLLALAGTIATPVPPAAAQDYPTKPVRMILPFAPGGSTDLIARMVSHQLTERLGKQFTVDNRAGAGGTVGTDVVLNSAPDGYTLLVVSMAHAVNPWLHKLKYQITKDFSPIVMYGTAASALLVHPSVPVNSVQELLALAKAKPGTLNAGHAGIGSFQHLAVANFAQLANIDIVQVPFKGGGPALIDVLGGHSQMLVGAMISAMPHIRSGKLKALGTSDTKRSLLLPDVPTIAEAGVPGYAAVNWFGLAAPGGTPQPVIDKLYSEVVAALAVDTVKQQFEKEASEVRVLGPAEFSKFINAETEKWGKVIKDGKITAE
jgi:tripartite-type tricarboxylate transporter receptor subunit TctC